MKIALVAMSGVRACDDELMRLGLTLPGFVERSKVIASLPSLGLLTLAGMTPDQHHIDYVEIPDLADLSETNWTRLRDADLVGISSYSAQISEAYELGDRLIEAGTPVVIGGPHVTHMSEEAKLHCSAVVIGEGELSWLNVLDDAERGELKSFYGELGTSFDLSDAPMPAFELLDITQYNRLTVQTSRGCPHQCEFCASSVLLTSGYSQKPAAKVLAEIDRICEIWETPFIEFADDNSMVNKSYWRELLPQLRERNIRWFTETDLSVADDPDLLTLMHESGCAQVLIGFESPTPDVLEGLDLRANWKRKHWPAYAEAIHTIQSHGISVNGCFILGLDGQEENAFDDVFRFVDETKLHEVQITIQTPFPGTPLYARLQSEGRLLEDRAWHKCTLFDICFQPRPMTVDQLRGGFHQLATNLYGDEFTHRRREHFREVRRANRA